MKTLLPEINSDLLWLVLARQWPTLGHLSSYYYYWLLNLIIFGLLTVLYKHLWRYSTVHSHSHWLEHQWPGFISRQVNTVWLRKQCNGCERFGSIIVIITEVPYWPIVVPAGIFELLSSLFPSGQVTMRRLGNLLTNVNLIQKRSTQC